MLRASRGWRNNPEIGIDALETLKIVLASARKTVLSCSECSEEPTARKFEGLRRIRRRSRSKSGPLRRIPLRIFDNQVERASRERSAGIGLIILTR